MPTPGEHRRRVGGATSLLPCGPGIPAGGDPTRDGARSAPVLADPQLGPGSHQVSEKDLEDGGEEPALVEHVPGEETDEWVVPERPGGHGQHLGGIGLGHRSNGDALRCARPPLAHTVLLAPSRRRIQ